MTTRIITSSGEKFRRAAAVAKALGDPWDQPPLKTATAWAAGQTITYTGTIRSNGGHWYVSANAGTTGATAPTHTTSAAVTDGGVLWIYYGPAQSTADDPLAPTITSTTSVPTHPAGGSFAGPLLTAIGTTGNFAGDKYALRGGYRLAPSSGGTVATFNTNASTVTQQHSSWEFETDGSSVALQFNLVQGLHQIIITDPAFGRRRLMPDGVLRAGTGTFYIQLDFVGGKRTRRIEICSPWSNSAQFQGARINSIRQDVWRPDDTDPIKAAFVGDSMWQGSSFGPFLQGGSFPQRVAKGLGWSDPWNFSIGGTGFVNAGASFYTFIERIPEIMTRVNPDVWVTHVSTNDTAGAAQQAATLAFLEAVRAVSNAPIILLGPVPINSNATTLETNAKAAFDEFADARCFWVPTVATADDMPWITGSWNNTAVLNPSGIAYTSFENKQAYIGGDNIHPIDAGTDYLAKRAIRAIRADVLPVL